MKRIQKTYVAETDGNGNVVCVWVDARGHKSTRPFDPKRDRFDEVASAEFSGASPGAIKHWMSLSQL